MWCDLETPSGRNTDCKQLSKNIWKSKRADQVQSRLEETWTWDGAAASWPLLLMRRCSVRCARLEQHAEDVHSSLVSAACGSHRDMNSVAGPAAPLTPLPPSAPASIPPSGPSPLSLHRFGSHSVTCLRSAFRQTSPAAG